MKKRALGIFLIFLIQFGIINILFASGNSNITITNVTANGGWSYASSTYTFTPSANNATINTADIVACLKGTNTALGGNNALNASTNGAGDVLIITACSGSGSQSGNITYSAALTVNTASSTRRTFTINAAGTYNQAAYSITMTPASVVGAGYPATNVVISADAGIAVTGDINCTGGSASTSSNSGGAGGSVTLTSSGGDVSIAGYTITTKGSQGGSGAGTTLCPGGAAGDVTITGTSVTINGQIDAFGGNGRAASGSIGGAGGVVTLTATSTTITTTFPINNYGGNGGSGATESATGGNGAVVSMTAVTNISIGATVTASGGNASNGIGNGGTGGNVTCTSTTGSVSTTYPIVSTGGAAGTSGSSNGNGGTGGTVLLTASTTISIAQSITTSGGTKQGTGTSYGGNVTLVGPSGVNTSYDIVSTGGTTGGTLTINDGNSTVTSGGANDGQSAAIYNVGAFTKLGSGNFSIGFGLNVWTGSTTITAGTLTLQSSGTAIPNSSNINFNGGSLVAPYSETVGTITISDNSVLKLSTGNHTLTYAASNGVSWTSGKSLVIQDWLGGYDGTAAGGSDPKFQCSTASAELNASHKAQLSFLRASNNTSYSATQLASGEIVPAATSLPVELINFNALNLGGKVGLKWSTTNEFNSDKFFVMRSINSIDFEIVGEVKAVGNSKQLLNYEFIDYKPQNGLNYYKLKEVDLDGKFQYSNIISQISMTEEDIITHIYPNPFSFETTIHFNLYIDDAILRVNDIYGKEIYLREFSGNQVILEKGNFINGIYFVSIMVDGKLIDTEKVVIE